MKPSRFLSLAAGIACLVFAFSCSSGSNDSPLVSSESSSSVYNTNSSSSSIGEVGNPSSSSNDENGGSNSSSSSVYNTNSSSSGIGEVGSSSSSNNSETSSSSVPLIECTDIFNPANKFCYNGTVYDKCNGKEYNPTNQKCENNIVQNQCGVDLYNPATQFCSGNKVYSKCDGMEYPPATHICSGNVATPAICNGIAYNPLEQRCCDSGVFDIADQCLLEYDGQEYRTVTIGTQIWMAENLNYSGDGSVGMCSGFGTAAAANCIKYGRLYNLATAKTVCPLGWHLPTRDEWNTLSDYVESRNGCSGCNAKHLKATIEWNNNGNGLDTYGFAALPGGEGDSGYFGGIGSFGYWWSESGFVRMGYDADWEYGSGSSLNRLYSVRCIHD
jgi:uncharacterized protein (TIGR02145 family)